MGLTNNITQLDLEWKRKRLGMITGSTFGDLIKKEKGGGYTLSDSQKTYSRLSKIGGERLVDPERLEEAIERGIVSTKAIQRGNDLEGVAIMEYMERTGFEVDFDTDFIVHNGFSGGTPDGFVGTDGLIEVKCPSDIGKQFKALRGEVYDRNYLIQMQFYLLITRRKWCDFVTYDDAYKYPYDISITRIERDEEMIQGIKKVIHLANQKIELMQVEIAERMQEQIMNQILLK